MRRARRLSRRGLAGNLALSKDMLRESMRAQDWDHALHHLDNIIAHMDANPRDASTAQYVAMSSMRGRVYLNLGSYRSVRPAPSRLLRFPPNSQYLRACLCCLGAPIWVLTSLRA